MIRNLNQVTFRCFGSVPSERTQTDRNLFRDDAAAVRLSRTEAVVYRAASETRISCGMGMSVLSASTDGGNLPALLSGQTHHYPQGGLFPFGAVSG